MVAAGYDHTVGLKKDGSVVTTGKRGDAKSKVPGWTDIVAIAAGGHRTVGLKSDGTVVATGNNAYGECDVSDWTNIVAIAAGGHSTVGLKADGTVVATESGAVVSSWKLFESVETIEQERAAAKVAAERQAEQRRLEAARKAEQKRIEAENRTARKLALSREKSDLMNELINLKGLFTGKRRREIESRIAEIDYELKGL